MPQSQFNLTVADQAAADALIAKTETIAGVKFVNVNIDKGTVIVTHSEDFDEAAFKVAAGI
ncbi:Uncharacterised protein [Moraxella caprae]|uniref:HMA domain-containing protein n=1 Tax=Moraxella caprae TaxID=90240 RepID=A0A378QXE2_9GAMM|nr:hypothetical protein [Moraxella caprae]STZ07644.1 Uncharacterised protein [Moraxella caprae]